MDEAMKHLGNVLAILAELHPDDRCKVLDNALLFFNKHNPKAQIAPVEGYVTRLTHSGPLQRSIV